MNRVFAYPIVVGPESIDVMKHTNNKEYLRWMEEAATAHSSLLGWNTERYFKVGQAFVAKAHWIEYLRPTFLGDRLTMYTWVENMQDKTSLRRFYLMRDKKVCMLGATQWAFIDIETGRGQSIPEEVSSSFFCVPSSDKELKELGIKTILFKAAI